MTRIRPRDLVFLIVICLIWAYNYVAVKRALTEFPPIALTFLRFALLGILLAPLLKIHRGQMGALIIAATLCGALNFGLLFYGMALTDNIASVSIASQLGIPFTTLLSVALLGEQVRWRRWVGVALSFAGVVVMDFERDVFVHGAALMFVIASSFAGALGVIAIKRVSGVKPLELQAWFATASWPLLLIMTCLIEPGQWHAVRSASAGAWLALAYIALASSLIGHTGYYYLVQRYPVSSIAPITVLSPIFAVIFSIAVLGNRLTERLFIGGVLTLGGVLIIALREKKIIDTGG